MYMTWYEENNGKRNDVNTLNERYLNPNTSTWMNNVSVETPAREEMWWFV